MSSAKRTFGSLSDELYSLLTKKDDNYVAIGAITKPPRSQTTNHGQFFDHKSNDVHYEDRCGTSTFHDSGDMERNIKSVRKKHDTQDSEEEESYTIDICERNKDTIKGNDKRCDNSLKTYKKYDDCLKRRSRSFTREKQREKLRGTSYQAIGNDGKVYGEHHAQHIPVEFAREQRKKPLGYKFLKILSVKEPLDILLTLTNRSCEFQECLHGNLNSDFIIIIVELLSKICDTNFSHNKTLILHSVCNTQFLDQISRHLSLMSSEKDGRRRALAESFMGNLLTFYETVIDLLPSSSVDKLRSPIIITQAMMESISDQLPQFQHLNERFVKIQMKYKYLLEHAEEKKKCTNVWEVYNFREKDVIPNVAEIMSKPPRMQANITKGAFQSVDQYLHIHFQLLREDFVSALREGIHEYLQAPSSKRSRFGSVRIYPHVLFKNTIMLQNQMGVVVQFDVEKRLKNIVWENTKRFMYGSFLCFTRNKFKDIIFATVLSRNVESLKKGEIIVHLVDSSVSFKDIMNVHFIMVESDIYFEPYFQVLNTLKRLDERSFPMKEYIIDAKEKQNCPKYLLYEPSVSYTINDATFEVLRDECWPDVSKLGLDKSQYKAFKAALTREFVIIQGPPGTGKTFMGLAIVKTLLKNCDAFGKNIFPIMVVAYTNHALDQFLEEISVDTEDIVRVGNQSKSSRLGHYNLKEKRKSYNSKLYASQLKEVFSNIEQITNNINIMQCNISILKNMKGIIGLSSLVMGVVTNQQLSCFLKKGGISEVTFCSWLLCDHTYLSTLIRRFGLEGESYQSLDDAVVDTRVTYFLTPFIVEEMLSVIKSKEVCEEITASVSDVMRKLEQPYKLDTKHIEELQKEKNLWRLPPDDRWDLYMYWVDCLYNKQLSNLNDLCNELTSYETQLVQVNQTIELNVLSKSKIIGLTTTGAARCHTLLQQVQSKIVIVEEAAEVLESHVVASLSDSCQHLILIGDHQQLHPKLASYHISVKYKLGVSLFERMVNNNMHCYQLEVQHRMRQEIAQLITPSIYKTLSNHPSVLQYENVHGVKKNVFFITHSHKEKEFENCESYQNPHEANFLIAFCRYLLQQGYKQTEITILTAYNGQMFLLRNMQKTCALLNNVKITAIDNYQGEENTIILLSLVRSNDDAKIGYLKEVNRVCVALSRAKQGLYIIGNMGNLTNSSKIWTDINETLLLQDSVGQCLTLKCQNHPEQETEVSSASDFSKVAEGGCSLACNVILQCGHYCKSVCHVSDNDHIQCKCYEPCKRVPENCPLEHICFKLCYQKCGTCKTLVHHTLPCGHEVDLPCFVNYETFKCEFEVKVNLLSCGHTVTKMCHIDVANFNCPVVCNGRLECGHSCVRTCHVNDDSEHYEYICNKKCARRNAMCSENHICQKHCFEECGVCMVEVKRKLSCGHIYSMKCSDNPASIDCKRKCKKTLPCGHPCQLLCSETCGGCLVKVFKIIDTCKHQIQTYCSAIPLQKHCEKPCDKKLLCGHDCTKVCGSQCTVKCPELVQSAVSAACGHDVRIPCYMQNEVLMASKLLEFCQEPCEALLECQHKCKGTCGECLQGRIHVACRSKCERTLICGHICKQACSQNCPPCKQQCSYRCRHSWCTNVCGLPCYPCKERCDWKCKHMSCSRLCFDKCDREPCYEPCPRKLKCGHRCIGFCGDPCPPWCRKCDAETVKEVFFGDEDDDNARFVYLKYDCRHILESNGMEKWLNQSGGEEIALKTCPRCRTPIMHTQRYMKYVKQVLEDINEIRLKLYASPVHVSREMLDIVTKFNGLKLVTQISVPVTRHLEVGRKVKIKIQQLKRKTKITDDEVRSLKFHVDFLGILLNAVQRLPKYAGSDVMIIETRQSFAHQFDLLLHLLMSRKEKLSTQEMMDFAQESQRFTRFGQLLSLMISGRSSYSTDMHGMRKGFESAMELVQSIERDSDEHDKHLKSILKQLNKEINIILIEAQKMAVKVLNLAKGHWFKCPNGHYYAIGECGGAMEVGKCADCGVPIGGQSHALLRSNELAPEMDGATRSAWPGPLYGAN